MPLPEKHFRLAPHVVVGIPSRNEAATIGGVVVAAVEGLRRCGLAERSVLINADNGSMDGTPEVFASAAGGFPHRCMNAPPVETGKGTNVLGILRTANLWGARRVVLLDADVHTVEPAWIGLLLRAVDIEAPAMAAPIYRRNRIEGNTTNHIASPLIGAAFGVHVEQPVAGDFAFNRAFVHQSEAWPIPRSAHLYGIDIHLTAHAAREGLRIVQVPLGRKIHNPGFPKILFGSQQVIDSLFHAIAHQRELIPRSTGVRQRRETVDLQISRPDPALVAETVAKALRYLDAEEASITEMFPSVRDSPGAGWGLHIDTDTWAQVLADALEALAAGHGTQARDHLVALYLSRVMTYWTQIDGLEPAAIDEILDHQGVAIAAAVQARGIRFDSPFQTLEFEPGYWAQDMP